MKPDDKAEIARRFKTLRHRALMTQLQLGRLICIGRQAVSDIEHRKVMPHYATWDRFAALKAKHTQPPLTPPAHWD